MLSRPADPHGNDEDEFLDKMDPAQVPGPAPSQNPPNLDKLQGITNAAELAMVMTQNDYEETKQSLPRHIQTELTEKESRFFALLQQGTKYDDLQATVPDSLDLAAVQRVVASKELPRVDIPRQSEESKNEDMARRAAYLALAAETEKGGKYQEYHDRFVAFYKKSN